jgi:AmiR/NasT family two-component response regulator
VEAKRHTRVLMGSFGAVAGLGIKKLLGEEGVELVAEERSEQDLVERLRGSRADVVLLDLDRRGVTETARDVASEFPGVTVVACSSDESRMWILRPHGAEEEERRLTAEELIRVVSSS